MKASRFSDAQKAFILKQGADGIPVADICRKAGISQATYFNWKKKYDGMLPPDIRRLKQFEDENAKLRKLVADLRRELVPGLAHDESSFPQIGASGKPRALHFPVLLITSVPLRPAIPLSVAAASTGPSSGSAGHCRRRRRCPCRQAGSAPKATFAMPPG